MIEKKDGTGIGWAAYYVSAPNFGWMETGYSIIPEERNKGYGTEAIHLLADYLFLSKSIIRIQAVTNAQNLASRQALVKAGFKREGTLRKALWNSKGELADGHLYCLLREEWKKPRILMKSSKTKKDQRESHCM